MTKSPQPPALKSLLSQRENRLPYYCYKLVGNGQYGLDVTFPDEGMDIDESNMSVVIPFASKSGREAVLPANLALSLLAVKEQAMNENHGNTKRDFGNWLAGLTDGEGCFMLIRRTQIRRGYSYETCSANFRIELRHDDLPILREIKSFLCCGHITKKSVRKEKWGECATFRVTNIDDLLNKVIPLFENHPLRAKKARDFEIWKRGIAVLARVKYRSLRSNGGRFFKKWTESDLEEFTYLHDTMRHVRKYNENPIKVPDKVFECGKRMQKPGFFNLGDTA